MSASQVTRMNISIPSGLRSRMDKAVGEVNWSETAARAFEAKLLELQSVRKADTTEDVVARLKAAEELEANEDYQAGAEAGREWARNYATPKQLRRLADYINENEQDNYVSWWDVDHSGWMAPFGASCYFAFAVLGTRDQNRDVPDQFWSEALGDNADRVQDADFFRGFGEGAAEVWGQVANKL